MKHTWTIEEDKFTYYLYLSNKNNIEKLRDFAKKMGIEEGTLRMRIKNFEYLDTNKSGLKNYAKQSKQVYLEFKNNPQKYKEFIQENNLS